MQLVNKDEKNLFLVTIKNQDNKLAEVGHSTVKQYATRIISYSIFN